MKGIAVILNLIIGVLAFIFFTGSIIRYYDNGEDTFTVLLTSVLVVIVSFINIVALTE